METVSAAAAAAADDVNALVGGLLRDLAFAQADASKTFGYKRAAAAVLALDDDLRELFAASSTPRVGGVGPASTRVIREVLETGGSALVEAAVAASPKRADIERRRGLRDRFLSRAVVRRVLDDDRLAGVSQAEHHADFQMHSEWSDGRPTLAELADACRNRGYRFAAVSDHSHGLKIAGGMSMEEAAAQRRALDELNRSSRDGFRLLQGIEANIDADGSLDLTDDEAARFEIVLAAPHSRLRVATDQTARMLNAVRHPHVRILAHPRGRVGGSRAGVQADWPAVFAAAAEAGVAIELDGDPSRQDLDFALAAQALAAGCLFALDSDAHSTEQLHYVETAIAHARLAAIPADRIVNCWDRERFGEWLRSPAHEARRAADA